MDNDDRLQDRIRSTRNLLNSASRANNAPAVFRLLDLLDEQLAELHERQNLED
jgi:hypothetical protein